MRVIQWATGSVGKAAIEGILLHPDLELVGCWVHSDSKNGVDVGEILGIEPLGVAATSSMDEILAMEADAVVYAPLIPNRDEVAGILRSGKNVVTPVGWFYPTEKDGAPLAAACARGRRRRCTAPASTPAASPSCTRLMFSALSSAVTFVRGEEFSDIRTYNAPDVVRHIMMFGGKPDEAMGGPMLGLLSGGFIQSVRMCLDALGFSAERRDPHLARRSPSRPRRSTRRSA